MRATVLILVLVLAVGACTDRSSTNGDATGTPASTGSAPSSPPPTVEGPVEPPPPAWAETESGDTWMAFGSYCWDNGCVDMVPPDQLPDVPQVTVAAGETVIFHLAFNPSEVSLAFFDGRPQVSLPAEPGISWEVSHTGFVALEARRPEGGSASYIAKFVVDEPSNEQ